MPLSSSVEKSNGNSHNGPSRRRFPLRIVSPGPVSDLSEPRKKPWTTRLKNWKVPEWLQWIPANWTWSKIKPVIRCAVAAWIAAVLFVIPALPCYDRHVIRFATSCSSFLSPPAEPFLAVLERETLILVFVCISWAWCCLGLFLANLARNHHDFSVTLAEAVSGQFIEPAPTVVLAVFLFFGSSFFLYIKARQGPGPYVFPTVFSCILLDLTMTTAVLFPFPFYTIGKNVVLPLALHSAIALVTSVFIFPSSVSAQFTTRLQLVLLPLESALDMHRKLMKMVTDSDDFAPTAKLLAAFVNKSEATLIPLAASSRLLPSDLVYSRFAPKDFIALQKLVRRMTVRANGMGVYFTLIDALRERFPVTPAPSMPATPGWVTPTAVRSRAPSVERGGSVHHGDSEPESPGDSVSPTPCSSSRAQSIAQKGPHSRRRHAHYSHAGSQHRHSHNHYHHYHHHSLAHQLHNSLLHLATSRRAEQPVVGVFESYRYLDLEATHFNEPDTEETMAHCKELLSISCDPLLVECRSVLAHCREWLHGVRKGRFQFWVKAANVQKSRQERILEFRRKREHLVSVLEELRSQGRLSVLEVFQPAFESQDIDVPSHRHLFHCYVYQYHLMQFADITVEMLDEIIHMEENRKANKLWTPAHRIFKWNIWEPPELLDHEDDEDPEQVQGLSPEAADDLGIAKRRDPDALPPHNVFEWVMSHVDRAVKEMGAGNSLFAFKAAFLTIIMCIPSFLASSATFAYENRFFWAIFMAQLTLARFRGDTTFGLVARIGATLAGGLVGTVMWYISNGGSSSSGNAYGLAAVCAVCFPFFFYGRLYWPGPPMPNVLFFVTSTLVWGYSYQDVYIVLPSSPGLGIHVFWRRFVLVTAGVTAAFLFSLLPPSTTIRRYHRALLANTASELGSIYCSIISFANMGSLTAEVEIVTSLVAIRSKLKRAAAVRTNITYEISLRGKWPANRYKTILDLQLQIAYSLSHLLSTIKHMEAAWTRAFLRRTRFLDPDFQGDVLAVLSMGPSLNLSCLISCFIFLILTDMIATGLRTGSPLPQITPCPLLHRFLAHSHGLEIIHKAAEEDYGLPRILSIEVLENEQYLMFCVSVSTAFGILTRLDRLMVAAKEIVGEQYHIQGVGGGIRGHGVEIGPRTISLQLRPPRDA
ncbi:hypothetical protein FISHEDRAFT_50366 [Fistulina hepatica ATCC 64428]|uniref:ER transporter 6TM N-terminal domain-containing protein n=1 Tax=Fistulina hepatica ATCC 64428 TaxID=1128425 RepID=A0A0D7A2F7_9AGAR|nr:hypothetical protein FISHEDRAFT_50366 [Fistulina hepatica ATCC 64428]